MKCLVIAVTLLMTCSCASSGTAYSTKGFSVGPVDNVIHIDINCPQAQQFLRGAPLIVMFPGDCTE